MTQKLFWADPYQTQLDTRITGVDGTDVAVAETILYAFSGGQESDRGVIGGYEVLKARKDGREIFYTLAETHGLKSGDAVTMTIDWERRYRLMRLHFAAELVLEVAYQNLKGIEKIGAHISQEKARIDFKWLENIAASFPLLTGEANRIIAEDHPILSAYSDETNERRYWEVTGFARVPCGGTHLKRTGEVGPIELKRDNIGRGKERIEVYLSIKEAS
ncbi:MAG: Alanine--tRNA ligase [Anaerolineales bacterium]|nr:Alanine--tRNA ligase [Anaerolineales bacterium]